MQMLIQKVLGEAYTAEFLTCSQMTQGCKDHTEMQAQLFVLFSF